MSDVNERIDAEMDDQDRALIEPFEDYIRDQEAGGRTFTDRERMEEFFAYWRPAGVTDAELDAAVDQAIAEGIALRRSKMA